MRDSGLNSSKIVEFSPLSESVPYQKRLINVILIFSSQDIISNMTAIRGDKFKYFISGFILLDFYML